MVSIGSCIVHESLLQYLRCGSHDALNAGPNYQRDRAARVHSLAGPLTSPSEPIQIYAASSVPARTSSLPPGGPVTFDNVSGGSDVGHFNATTGFPANFALDQSWHSHRDQPVAGCHGNHGAAETPGFTSPIKRNLDVRAGNWPARIGQLHLSGAPLAAETFTVPPAILSGASRGNVGKAFVN